MYVNPIEILGLSDATDINSIDNEIVKKAKRKLYADIDLSDNGEFEYYGLQLTKGSCEKAIDDLTNYDYKEFYLYLANNKPLNEFLVNGNSAIFKNFKQDSIFKLPEFIKFISPYFAPKFDKALLNAYENNLYELAINILNTSKLTDQTDLNIAFKSVSNLIQNKIEEIDELTREIKNEEDTYDLDDLEDIVQWVKDDFPAKILNNLPQYFDSQVLKITKSINYLSNAIWDAFDTTQIPHDLTEYLLTLKIGGIDRPIFENNYKIFKKKNDERIEQSKNEPLLKKWALVLLKIRETIENVENKNLKSKEAFKTIKDQINLSELNSLPSFANEIRTQIGYSIRSLSIAFWNSQNDIICALESLEFAMQINVENDAFEKFRSDKAELLILKSNYYNHFNCNFCDINPPVNEAGFNKMLYLENNRYSNRVEYSQSSVLIPRCAKCKKTHNIGNIIYYSTLSILLILLFRLAKNLNLEFDFSLTIGVLLLCWITSKLFISIYMHIKNVTHNSDIHLKLHPLFKTKMEDGWTFDEPSATPLIQLVNILKTLFELLNQFVTYVFKIILSRFKAK